MRRAWTIAILVAGLAMASRAAAATPLDFAAPESGARTLALAGTGTAVADGAGAVWWNPAGLADGPSCELLLAHVSLLRGLAHQSGVFSLRPLSGRGLVFALQADIVREAGIPVPEVAPGLRPIPPRAGYRGALHVAGELGHGVALGFAVGRMRGLPGMLDPGPRIVGDAGLRWRHAGTRAGLALRGATLDGGSKRSALVSAGVAQSVAKGRLLGSVEFDRDAGGGLHPSGGFEWQALRGLVLRAGARYEDAERGTSGTGGLCLRHDRLRLDYALQAVRGSSAVHAITLGFDLGSPASLPRAPAAIRDSPRPALEDASPRPARPSRQQGEAPRAPRAEQPVVVRAGPYANLDAAAEAILKLRRVDLRPVVLQQGREYFLVLDRGLSRLEAERIQTLAGRAGVRSTIVPE